MNACCLSQLCWYRVIQKEKKKKSASESGGPYSGFVDKLFRNIPVTLTEQQNELTVW